MEIYTTVCYWVNDRSRAGCLVFMADLMPLRSYKELTTRAKCYNRVWDYRAAVQCYWSQAVNPVLNWTISPPGFIAYYYAMTATREKYSHGTWTLILCMCILQAGRCIFHESWVLFFFLFIRFLWKAPPLIPDIKPDTRVSTSNHFFSCLKVSNTAVCMSVCIGNVETNWNRSEKSLITTRWH